MENYSFIRVVGKGSYGEVTLVRHKVDGKQYVIKKLNLRNSSKRERKAAEQEAQLLSQLRHPNIVTYRESWEGEDCQLYIAMGFCEGGDLYHRLKEQKGRLLTERQVVEWFVQIAMALQYLHEKHILHRDLKTQNIFLTKTNIIKVGDLGIARVLENQNDMASTLIGTPYYMSPELFSNKPYNYKSDVWALGCCVYEMATLKHAFNAKDMNSLVYRIVEGKLPPMPKEYNPQLGEIIRSMLNKRPEDRPEVKHILRQPYIKHQISVFLEATKEKTAKSRKKVSNCRPSNAASVASTHLNQDSLHQRPPEPNKRKVMKKESCSRLNKESTTASGIQPCPKPFPQQALGQDIFHSTGLSLATISGIDIDVKPSEERKNKKGELLTPDTCLKELSGGSGSEELKRLSNGSAAQDAQPQQVLKTANKTTVPVNHPDWTDDMTDKDNTLKLLQSISMKNNLPELKETLDTEKLLEPFVPVIIPELSHEGAPPPPGQGAPQLQPHSSTSEPSLSRQRRQRNREKAQESKDQFKAVPPRPLPSPPRSTDLSDVKKSQGNMENPKHGLCSHLCSSSDSAVAVSQDRPLSARERRRLKQSQEGISHSAVPASRRASCSTVTENKHPIGHSVAGSSSATDIVTKVEKPQSRLAQRHSDEDECSSSTSSTERLEGDGREGKSDSSEMQDLVQLMTQTLRMDSRDTGCVHEHPIPLREFKLNRKYRDTLILHGKAKEEQENFYFREFPTDSTSGPAKIKRVIECLRTDAVKGLGVKLLDKVLDIMEEDDEVKRELHLREQMGEDKYKQYAVMVRQLKFFEDVIFKE
ncbi:serine/threonine-protein kinase Nek4 isoform X1 [Lepisosteus oculatus]|uniref:serine/threonine-protein kinase Nek4 isoform X1 n=1 Tax=Lepisosteus oculatus TaxID=7918 RepID=UPI00074022E0|nr:PREDICTED: serine/threonine-protein kinase Nek4 isoform X1 [Lepisosteus oculatus]